MTTTTYPYTWTLDAVDFPDRGERALLLWVCIDCYFELVNGEEQPSHEHDGEPCEPWSHESAANVTPGRLTETVPEGERDAYHDHDLWTEAYETDGFSKSPCDACRCPLAGERFAVTQWLPL